MPREAVVRVERRVEVHVDVGRGVVGQRDRELARLRERHLVHVLGAALVRRRERAPIERGAERRARVAAVAVGEASDHDRVRDGAERIGRARALDAGVAPRHVAHERRPAAERVLVDVVAARLVVDRLAVGEQVAEEHDVLARLVHHVAGEELRLGDDARGLIDRRGREVPGLPAAAHEAGAVDAGGARQDPVGRLRAGAQPVADLLVELGDGHVAAPVVRQAEVVARLELALVRGGARRGQVLRLGGPRVERVRLRAREHLRARDGGGSAARRGDDRER